MRICSALPGPLDLLLLEEGLSATGPGVLVARLVLAVPGSQHQREVPHEVGGDLLELVHHRDEVATDDVHRPEIDS
ncbi:hypothetical protein [Nonomuraea dietziae]|uniref:hypothetical protein n=1 Tax=Nonomuraea dietziae TaxID=65515 RepID=UPI0031DA8293